MKHISGVINRVPDSPQPTLQPAGWKHSSIWGELVTAPCDSGSSACPECRTQAFLSNLVPTVTSSTMSGGIAAHLIIQMKSN